MKKSEKIKAWMVLTNGELISFHEDMSSALRDCVDGKTRTSRQGENSLEVGDVLLIGGKAWEVTYAFSPFSSSKGVKELYRLREK